MATTKFAQLEFNRVIQEELIYTNFVDFEEGLVLALQGIIKHVKIHTFPMGIMEASFFLVGNTSLLAPFRYLMV